jgi:diguanylate cyclase (GGDEF)-like protein/PAS domain S-box-containing protein
MSKTKAQIKLLTVDDEEAIRGGLTAYFEDSGYLVSQASDGAIALQVMRQKLPDIIVTDLRMPHMDGLELIDIVVKEFENLPVVVLSGTGVLTDAIEALRRGAWDYLTKPIQDLAELEIVIKRSLERARLIAENRHYQTHLEELVTERTIELRKLFTAVEQSTHSVVITDIKGVIEYANPCFCSVSGYSLQELIGQNPSIVKSGYHSPNFYSQLWQTISSGLEWRGELRNKRKDGSFFWEMCSITAVRSDHDIITHFVAIKQDITDHKAEQERLAWQASHDTLTGLYNRFHLETYLQATIRRMDKQRQYLSIILVDIDNLKFVNDTFGHDFGDRLLIEIGKRLKETVCTECVIGRFLGDEFVLISDLSENPEQTAMIAEQVMRGMSSHFVVDGVDLAVTTSIGFVTFPHDDDNVANLFRNAEAAMHEAKSQGRDTIVPYTREFHRRAQHQRILKNHLRLALQNSEFSLHFQPQIYLKQCTVYGVEALLRWNPSDQPPISPAEFIPILEESNMIVEVGGWVLHEACRQAVEWSQNGLSPVRMSVNISTVQFQRGDLAKTINQALIKSGLDPSLLCLELTESLLMVDTNNSRQRLLELRNLGVDLSLDDFGTGYSSLAYLSRLPVQELKIDQSFVRNLNGSRSNTAVVNSIIAMGLELGLELVAEGVETLEQKNHLLERGCNTAQGFLFSRPLPANECFEFIKRSAMI